MFSLKPNFAKLGTDFFSHVQPEPLDEVSLVHINHQLQQRLGLVELSDEDLCQIIGARQIIAGYKPIASVYAGHQFGVAVSQLGDGRAMIIAEQLAADGSLWELQLKGCGRTPYSRMGDGRAVLRSTIREYLASHAMAKLGIATTEAIGMVNSTTQVYREKVESAAIVMRVAHSFIRFGHFQWCAWHQQPKQLKQLIDFVITNYYPAIVVDSDDYIAEFLAAVVKSTAELIAAWQGVGFVHGVMNTDNMSILGLTIDYGPYAFMDKFDPDHIYNHSDSEGRYTFAHQVGVGLWNLYRLAESLSVIYPQISQLEQVLAGYTGYYNESYLKITGSKLGFDKFSLQQVPLAEQLFKIMYKYRMDWTYTWRQLSYGVSGYQDLVKSYHPEDDFNEWYRNWQQELNNTSGVVLAYQLMQEHNPAMVLRTHLLQEAIAKAESGDYSEVANLFTAVGTPYRELTGFGKYYQLPPDIASPIELSCSS